MMKHKDKAESAAASEIEFKPSNRRTSIRWMGFLVYNVIALILLVTATELALMACLRFPVVTGWLPEESRFYPLYIYTMFDRQRLYEDYEYDERLVYRLRPHLMRQFSGREFDVTITANSIGLRDDEVSLAGPDIIALGDSFTMGWGVEAEETFAEKLGVNTALKVLNAGIPSYGTVREVRLFNEFLDISQVSHVVMQYCENDFEENKAYLVENKPFTGAGRGHFYRTLNEDRVRTHYYFPRYSIEAFSAFASRAKTNPWKYALPMDELDIEYFHLEHALFFLRLLEDLELSDDTTRLILLNLTDVVDTRFLRDEWTYRRLEFNNSLFIQLVQKCIEERTYPEFIEQAILLDMDPLLCQSDYFMLDGHINKFGHAKVAEALSVAVEEGKHFLPERVALLTTREGRTAFSANEPLAPLPQEAFLSKITCFPDVLEIRMVQEEVHVDLAIENQSTYWWPVSRGIAPYNLKVRTQLLDADGKLLDRDYRNGDFHLPRPVGPNSILNTRLHFRPDMFPPGVSHVDVDLVQDQVAWFSKNGGIKGRIKVVRH